MCEACAGTFVCRGVPSRTRFCPACRDSAYREYDRTYAADHSSAPRQAAYRRRNGGNGPANHGVSADAYAALWAGQGGTCAVCGTARPCEWVRGNLELDHCHETGEVRGLLCGDCNSAAGRVGDDASRLRRLADYLDGSRTGVFSRGR